MGRIEKILLIKGDKGEKELNVLFDSGADKSLISISNAKEICDIKGIEGNPIVIMAGESKYFPQGACYINTILTDNGKECIINEYGVFVMPDEMFKLSKEEIKKGIKPLDIIIGASTMQGHKIKLQFDDDEESENKIDLSRCGLPYRRYGYKTLGLK